MAERCVVADCINDATKREKAEPHWDGQHQPWPTVYELRLPLCDAHTNVAHFIASIGASEREDHHRLSKHHSAAELAKVLGVTETDAWGKPCPVCAPAYLLSRRTEGLAAPADGGTRDGGSEVQE